MWGAYKSSSNGKPINDEWYTRKEDVEKILSDFNLEGLKIYCPCDSKDSEWVKYLSNIDCELKYTSDDYANHDDLRDWADIVITNPPFGKFSKFLKWLDGKNIIICASALSTHTLAKYRGCDIILCDEIRKFIRPDGSIKEAATVVVCNMEVYNKYGKTR